MRARRGFTLIEVLIVMSLLGVLFGLSIGLVAKAGRGNALVQAANSFASQIASARAQSYGSDTAYVKLDADEEGTTTIRSFRQRQVFHCPFEDLTSASEDVMVREGDIAIAEGPRPSGEGRHAVFSSGKIVLGAPPWLQFRDGFSIKCMVNPAPDADHTNIELFKKGHAFLISLRRTENGTYDVRCKLKLEENSAANEKGGDYILTTGWRGSVETPEWRGPVLPGRWSSLAIAYDRNRLTIHVNERLRGVRSDKTGAMRLEPETDFVIGNGYIGGFDSLLISGIFEDNDDAVKLPGTVSWVKEDGTPHANETLDIHFRNRGLDPGKHPKPVDVTFRLAGEGGAKRVVHVSVSGEPTVRTP